MPFRWVLKLFFHYWKTNNEHEFQLNINEEGIPDMTISFNKFYFFSLHRTYSSKLIFILLNFLDSANGKIKETENVGLHFMGVPLSAVGWRIFDQDLQASEIMLVRIWTVIIIKGLNGVNKNQLNSAQLCWFYVSYGWFLDD